MKHFSFSLVLYFEKIRFWVTHPLKATFVSKDRREVG